MSFAIGALGEEHSSVILDERMAGFFGLGRAKASPGELVVLVCTSGSAGAHYLPALIEADYSGVPLLAITCDRPNHLRHTGSAQTIDQRNFFGHHVVSTHHIDSVDTDANLVGEMLEEAVQTALSHQGPVHINVGFDEPLHRPDLTENNHHPGNRIAFDGPNQTTINEVVSALNNAKNGAIIWGPGSCTSAEDRSAAERLMSALGWPSLAHGASQLRGSTAEMLLPHAAEHWLDVEALNLSSRDCILYLGQAPTSRTLSQFLASQTAASVISLSKGRHVVRPWKHGLAFAHQSADMLNAIAKGIQRQGTMDHEEFGLTAQAIQAVLTTSDKAENWSGKVLRRFIQSLPSDTQMQLGNSLIIRDVDLYCSEGSFPAKTFANRGVNGIDGQLSTAAGIASANPNVPSVLICGDLTALHDVGALGLAKAYNVSICIIDNDGGAIFNQLPFAESSAVFDRFFVTPQAFTAQVVADSLDIPTSNSTAWTSSGCERPKGSSPPSSMLYQFQVNAELGKEMRLQLSKGIQRVTAC